MNYQSETMIWLSLFYHQNTDMVAIVTGLLCLLFSYIIILVLSTIVESTTKKKIHAALIFILSFTVGFWLYGFAKQELYYKPYNFRYHNIAIFDKINKNNYQVYTDKDIECRKRFTGTENDHSAFREHMNSCK